MVLHGGQQGFSMVQAAMEEQGGGAVQPGSVAMLATVVGVASFCAGIALGLDDQCSGVGGSWNPVVFYRDIGRLANSPWAWVNSDVGAALRGAKKEVGVLMGSTVLALGAYAYSGPAAALKAVTTFTNMSQGSSSAARIANGLRGSQYQECGEPEWVDSAMPTRRRRGEEEVIFISGSPEKRRSPPTVFHRRRPGIALPAAPTTTQVVAVR